MTRWPDPARGGEDFLLRRDRYQFTPLAVRLNTFWSHDPHSDEEGAADVTLTPRAIHDRLTAFVGAVSARNCPSAASEFQQMMLAHRASASAALTWQRSMAHPMSGDPNS